MLRHLEPGHPKHACPLIQQALENDQRVELEVHVDGQAQASQPITEATEEAVKAAISAVYKVGVRQRYSYQPQLNYFLNIT